MTQLMGIESPLRVMPLEGPLSKELCTDTVFDAAAEQGFSLVAMRNERQVGVLMGLIGFGGLIVMKLKVLESEPYGAVMLLAAARGIARELGLKWIVTQVNLNRTDEVRLLNTALEAGGRISDASQGAWITVPLEVR